MGGSLRRDLRIDIDADPSGLNRGFKSAEASAKVFERELAKIESKRHAAMNDLGTAAIGLGTGLVVAFGAAVKVTADFDKQMSAVAAATGQQGKALDLLRDAAIKAGAATTFSATEAAQAEAELAKVGLSTSDILSGALKGSLDLAAAGTLDLADAAKISGEAMTIFGLKGQDVEHIADVLTAGANASSASVESMAESLQQAGLVSAQTGLSLEDTVGTLTALSKGALNGSDAGTSLKTMLQRLSAPAADAAGLMEKLGIHAYDAAGQFVGIDKVAGQLRTSLSKLTPAQRNAALATIFGSDAIRAANVLYTNGEQGIRGYISAVNKQGAASQQAGKLTDNLAGDLERLQGSLETALISGGSGATDVLRGLVKAADGAVGAFNDLPGPVQAGVTALLGIGGAATVAGGALLLIIPKIAETKAALITMGITADTAKSKLIGVGKGVAIAAAAFVASEGAGEVTSWLRGGSEGADSLSHSLAELGKSGKWAQDLDAQWGGAFASGEDAARRFGDAVRETVDPTFFEKAWEHPLSSITSILPGFTSTVTDFKGKFQQMDAALAQMVTSGHADQANVAFTQLAARAKAAGIGVEQLRTLFPGYTDALKNAKGPAQDAASATGEITTEAEKAATAMKGLNDQLQGIFDPSINAYEAQTRLKQAISDARIAIKKAGGDFDEAAVSIDKGSGAISKSGEAALDARGKFAGLLHAVVEAATDQGTLARTSDAAREAFLRQLPLLAQLAGKNSDAQNQVAALAQSFGVSGSQAQAAGVKTQGLIDKINGLHGKDVDITAHTAAAAAAFEDLRRRLLNLHNKTITITQVTRGTGLTSNNAGTNRDFHAEGGFIAGPGSGTSDSIPAMLSNGEFVVNAAATGRHRGLLESINAQKFADGGFVGVPGFATGGMVDVPLAEFIDRYLGKTATKADVTKATSSYKDAVDQLRRAERKLADDRRHHRSGRTIADDEARVRKERRDLTAATDKLRTTEANYRKAKQSPIQKFSSGLVLGIKNTEAFIKNITKLSDMGFGALAQQLLAMGGPDAEKYAAAAVKLSKTKLKSLNANIERGARDQARLESLGNVLAIKDALRHGARTVPDIERYTGLSEDDIAAANQQAKLFERGGIERYAGGGFRPPPGVATRPTVLFGEGRYAEGYVPYDPRYRTRAKGLIGQMASDFGMGGSAPVINLTIQGAIDPIGTARQVEKVLRKYVRTNGRVALDL